MIKLKYWMAAALAALLLVAVPALAATETDIPDPPPSQTEPSEPTEPTEPTEPSEPTEPGEPAPTPPPTPSPTPAPAAISVLVDEGSTHIYDETGSVMIRWSEVEGASGYTVTFTQSGQEILRYGPSSNRLEVRMAALGVGTFTVTVTTAAGNRGTCTLRLKNEGDPDEPDEPDDPVDPTPTPEEPDKPGGGGRRPGGRRPGGFRPGGMGGEGEEADTGLKVTPGTALSTTHAAGSKDMTRYDEIALSISEDSMTELALGSGQKSIRCGGKAFTASLPADVLTLTAEEEAEWELTLEALEILARSGITGLLLQDADGCEFNLDTALTLAGQLYGELRRAGYVSSDFQLLLDENGLAVEVDGYRYRIIDGELNEEAV